MSRTRSTTDINVAQGPYIWRGYNNTGGLTSTYSDNFTHTKVRSIVDDLTPDYLGKLSRGEFLPINACTISTIEEKLISAFAGTIAYKTPATLPAGNTAYYTGAYAWHPTPPSLPTVTLNQSDIDAVVIKALASAKEPDWDVLTFIGEFPQTVRLIAKRVRGVNRIAKRVARRAFRRETRRSRRVREEYHPGRALDDFTSLWLEARYGWRPLIYDVQSMMKALRHKTEVSIQRKSARLEKPVTASAGPSHSDDGVTHWAVSTTREGKIRYRAVVFYKGDMSPIGANPVITAWELTKFSFVVDWFVNVGAWIQAISPRIGYDQLGVSVSAVQDYTDTITSVGSEGSGHLWSVSVTPVVRRKTYKVYWRQAYTGIPLPSIQVNLNPFKIVDLISLALQGQRDVMRILRL